MRFGEAIDMTEVSEKIPLFERTKSFEKRLQRQHKPADGIPICRGFARSMASSYFAGGVATASSAWDLSIGVRSFACLTDSSLITTP